MNKTTKYLLGSIIAVLSIALLAKAFSLLGRIHGQELPESYFSAGYPTIIALLDSEFFMGLIFLITLLVILYVLYLLWQLHEIAIHRAKKNASPQLQLVFALSLSGLFIDKLWWVLAVIIAFTSWDHIGSWLADVIHDRGRSSAANEDRGSQE